MLFYCLFNGHYLSPSPQGTLPLSSPRLAVLNARVLLILFEARSTVYPLPLRHAPANFARLAVLNASFASLAFVKYRGAQIALWEGDRQCSLVLEYKRRGRCAVLLCIRICQRVRMEWNGCAVPFHQPYFYIIHIRILSECGV